MMISKKSFFALFYALSLYFVCTAEINPPNRFIEIGNDLEFSFSNNSFSLPDYMKKELVIDLSKEADRIDSKGLIFNTLLNDNLYFNLNFGKKFRLGFFTGISQTSSFDIGKGLFDFIANGNALDEVMNFKAGVQAQAYTQMGFSIGTNINNVQLKITPCYFVPLIYIPQTNATMKAYSGSDGTSYLKGGTDFTVYSAISFEDFKDTSDAQTQEEIQYALEHNGGFDISVNAEYPFSSKFDAGVYTTIPIIAGKLNYKMTQNFAYSYVMEELLDTILHGQEMNFESENSDDDAVYSSASYKVRRPFRFGFEAAYRPFYNWIYLYPSLGFAVRNPGGKDSKFYMEYSLRAALQAWNFLGVQLFSNYNSMLFTNGMGLRLNIRLVELNTQLAFASPRFIKSFSLSGIYAGISIKVGL